MSDHTISVAIAGSTERTVQCATALLNDPRFCLEWVLTPTPKPLGRKQEIIPNPVHQFALVHLLDSILIEDKIDSEIREKISKSNKIDILLVVDFGYIVPAWLLAIPTVAPLNIHPSTLPRWRGSSPGQFVLLYGETQSAVTVIVMNDALDQGDIVAQLPFAVDSTWTQSEYYHYSFSLVASKLPDIISDLAAGTIPPQPQPLMSPTPSAVRLTRKDGYIDWNSLRSVLSGETAHNAGLSAVLMRAANHQPSLAALISAACRAFSPWPGIWTYVTTNKGQQRMKILTCQTDPGNPNKLVLISVQMEGKPPTPWIQVEHSINQLH